MLLFFFFFFRVLRQRVVVCGHASVMADGFICQLKPKIIVSLCLTWTVGLKIVVQLAAIGCSELMEHGPVSVLMDDPFTELKTFDQFQLGLIRDISISVVLIVFITRLGRPTLLCDLLGQVYVLQDFFNVFSHFLKIFTKKSLVF